MVLESCMILLDNSEYMRNGDYVPTRLEAQHDAANLLVGTKTQSNPESTVGVIAMTGEIDGGGAELLISPTDDMGKILSSLHGVPIRSGSSGGGSTGGAGAGGKKRAASGEARATSPTSVLPPDGSDITGAIQVASLALKHRRNKNGAQRVVVFVGSPLTCDARALTKCGRQLKKNNVAIDVIALGELEQNEPLLRELVDAANGTASASSSGAGGEGGAGAPPAPPVETTCHLVTIPAGVLPSDVLVTSPIIHPGGAPAAAAVGAGGGGGGTGGDGGDAGGFAEYGGVDPNMDPELAMALRVSMEEERARQERAAAAAAAAAAAEGGGGEEGKAGEGGGDASTAAAGGGAGEGGAAKQADGTEPAAAAEGGDGGATAMAVDGKAGASSAPSDEDALLQQALAMSMGEDGVASANAAAAAAAAAQGAAGGAVGMETDEDDAAMQLALQMSMQAEGGGETPQKKEGEKKEVAAASAAGAGAGNAAGQFQDQQFVNQLLGSLPGVDPNDPAIQDALRNLQQQQGQGGKKEGEEEGGAGDKKKDDK